MLRIFRDNAPNIETHRVGAHRPVRTSRIVAYNCEVCCTVHHVGDKDDLRHREERETQNESKENASDNR